MAPSDSLLTWRVVTLIDAATLSPLLQRTLKMLLAHRDALDDCTESVEVRWEAGRIESTLVTPKLARIIHEVASSMPHDS
jgi:hypothetical protein